MPTNPANTTTLNPCIETRISPRPSRSLGKASLLSKLFIVLFVQLFLLILVSLIEQHGPVFVAYGYFGWDFHVFYVAASDLLHHVDPYLRGGLVTPPSSILVGLALCWLPFKLAAVATLVLNLGLIYLSLVAVAREFRLSRLDELLLLGIAAGFYPVFVLVERGNLDGLMLALLVFGFRTRNKLLRSVLLGASMALKVYSGLLLLILLRRRSNWNVVLGAVAVCIALELPFLHLLPSFWGAVTMRSGFTRFPANISPAALLWLIAGGNLTSVWTHFYLVLWAGTLAYRLKKDWGHDISQSWPVYVPWMISFPETVYPYSGVLTLALLALIAGECQRRPTLRSEKRIVIGIALLGFQASAWLSFLDPLGRDLRLLDGICALGTLLVLLGACALPDFYGRQASIS